MAAAASKKNCKVLVKCLRAHADDQNSGPDHITWPYRCWYSAAVEYHWSSSLPPPRTRPQAATHQWKECLLGVKRSSAWDANKKKKRKSGRGDGVLVWAQRLVSCVFDWQNLVCYWEMTSSSWVGFKSTTVVPRSEAPPIPSVDDDGWEFLLVPPPRGRREGGASLRQVTYLVPPPFVLHLPWPAEEEDGGRALAPPPPPPPLVWEQTLAWRAAAFCL